MKRSQQNKTTKQKHTKAAELLIGRQNVNLNNALAVCRFKEVKIYYRNRFQQNRTNKKTNRKRADRFRLRPYCIATELQQNSQQKS